MSIANLHCVVDLNKEEWMNNAQQKNIKTMIDVVVHVDEQLDEQNRRRVEHNLLKARGVIRAYFNNERQHLLLVGYDPVQTDSSKILRLVRQHRLGAQLIGGL